MGQERAGRRTPIDETYLLPVRIGHASMDVLRGSDVAYYVVKRSSAITVAAQLTGQLDRIPDPRLSIPKQQGLERSDGCNL